jgi:hypothetical protein
MWPAGPLVFLPTSAAAVAISKAEAMIYDSIFKEYCKFAI